MLGACPCVRVNHRPDNLRTPVANGAHTGLGSRSITSTSASRLALGIAKDAINRTTAFSQRWGGLALPPAPQYDGGPRLFWPDTPEGSASEGW